MSPRSAQQRFVSMARRSRALTALVDAGGRRRAVRMVAPFVVWLPQSGRVLDIGTGTGHVAAAVAATGRDVVLVDRTDLRFVGAPLIRCDGGALPFRSSAFDASLLITVLHHIPALRHETIVGEALRVLKSAGRLIILEDTYRGPIERRVEGWQDSLMNLEFAGHPHSNRSLDEWTELVADAGGRICHRREWVTWYGPFRMRHGLIVADR